MPPEHYGGIERIVDMLAHGLVDRGVEVTLFANSASNSAGRLRPWPGRSSVSAADTIRNAASLACTLVRGEVDLVHSFSRIAYMAPILPARVPKIMSYQRAITPRTVRWGHTLSRGTLSFTAVSRWMTHPVNHIGHWSIIANGVPLGAYAFRSSVAPDAPFIFLGRIEEIKGPHLAIDIARRANRSLVIAGTIPADKRAWAEAHVLSRVDGAAVRYVGPVDDVRKNALLGASAALLMPVLWDEPFGIVMAEAMACGTPVLGLRRGAVPEVVEEGVTGFVGDTVDDLVTAVVRLGSIDRRDCRRRVETYYCESVVVEQYLRLYRARLEGGHALSLDEPGLSGQGTRARSLTRSRDDRGTRSFRFK